MDLREHGLKTVCEIYQIETEGNYQVEWVDARSLVIPERLDLISKIVYVDYYINHRDGDFAVELYKKDLEVCTNGTYSEYGNGSKKTFKDYCNIFDALIDDIEKNGFNKGSIIPVDSNGVIMDGAHRTAVAAYLGRKVPIIRFNVESPAMDPDLYQRRMASREIIEFALTEMCKWNDNLYLCCMWPAAENIHREEAVNILCYETDVFYKKTIDINTQGLGNLIPQIYLAHDWVGSIDDRFMSAAPKIEGVSGNGKLEVFLFRADKLEHVKEIKNRMRAVFGINENSLHITDYPEETMFIAQMMLSDNTISFLNNANPFHYIDLNKRIYQYKEAILSQGGKTEDYIIDSSTIMGLYGIRKPDDLDYLYTGKNEALFDNVAISNHEGEISYHGMTVDDLIYDTRNCIYYAGLKIISLNTLVRFKNNRNSTKDREDLSIIKGFIENKHRLKRNVITALQTIRRKTRNAAYTFLRNLPGGGTRRQEICITC